MLGPVLRSYKAGSIIYFIDDKGSDIFVLQTGRIMLISNSLDGKTEIKEEVHKGEFFGVKSALGLYPREETAQVLTDATVLSFNIQSFEAFCMNNTRIVMQMLKVFSGQLRKVHRKVRETLGQIADQENSIELLKTAEYFFKQNEKEHAKYALSAFLKHYTNSEWKDRATQLLNLVNSGQSYPLTMSSIEEEMEKKQSNNSFRQPQSFNISSDVKNTGNMQPPPLSSFGSSHDSHIPDIATDLDLSMSDDLDLSLDDNTQLTPSQIYYDGVNAFSQQKWDEAIAKFENVLSIKNFNNSSDAQFIEKSLFELGRTYSKKGDTTKCIEKFSEFVKKYPRSEMVKKAIIGVAEAYEKRGDKARAASLFNRVVTMPPKDRESNYAQQQVERLK